MGKRARPKPERLSGKLLQIRNAFGLSQAEMLRRLEAEESIPPKQISKYELGVTEPPLFLILRYSRMAGVHMEALVDDDLDLPEKLPGDVRYSHLERAYASRKRGR